MVFVYNFMFIIARFKVYGSAYVRTGIYNW